MDTTKIVFMLKIITVITSIISLYFIMTTMMPNTEQVVIDKVDNVNVSLEDIVGLDTQKEWIQKVMNSPVKPNGILLYGPPGTGKTMIAKAVATSNGGNFINVTPSMLQSKFYGDTPRLIDDLFKKAKKNAPCVLFFDEMDGIFSSRNAMTEQADRVLKTTLLSCMDGMNSVEGVMFMGATNRIHDLDEAVKRRFRMQIKVGLPSQEHISSMLNISEEEKQSDRYNRLLNKLMNKQLSCSDINQLNTFVQIQGQNNIDTYKECLKLFF